ncbi:MAG TPA: c-type cytochrome [Pelomicrobium sp.]|nr:c-type cytochrome [Pelomicrobium sp.]
MKTVAAVLISAGLLVAGPAVASEDLAKKLGCTTCHAVDKKKMGPSLKDISAKFKGQAGAADKLTTAIAKGDGHPKAKGSEADIKKVVEWVLAM